jgi:hypothetical protein
MQHPGSNSKNKNNVSEYLRIQPTSDRKLQSKLSHQGSIKALIEPNTPVHKVKISIDPQLSQLKDARKSSPPPS